MFDQEASMSEQLQHLVLIELFREAERLSGAHNKTRAAQARRQAKALARQEAQRCAQA
jgi:hypothetical protein